MTHRQTCQVIVEPEPSSGCWNMAVDESLLEAALDEDACYVRCYRWAEPTISLGYFQDAAAATAVPELSQLPVVRRLSGGGAILHHHELTYSCVLPSSHPLTAVPQRLYLLVHARIVKVLARQGVTSSLRGSQSSISVGFDSPPLGAISSDKRPDTPLLAAGRASILAAGDGFLCFGRSDPRDIVIGGHKVVGSAQRRRKGAVLQHGSLLLARSQHARQFPGIRELCPTALLDGRLAERLAGELGGLLGGGCRFVALAADLRRRANQLKRERYSRTDWTTVTGRRRTEKVVSTR